MTTTPAIEASQLVKTFGSTRALDGFNLEVQAGQIAGFLGPNGAGKSTAIRILLGLLRADSGTARVLGQDAFRDSVAIHERVTYVPGDVNLWPNLTGGEAIDLLSKLGRRRPDRQRRDELVESFNLDPTKKARTYSKGNRQKVALIAALASDAELLLLDEPTSGLDPLMETIFTEELRRLRSQGRTVLLSSHILGEVEKLCDTVTIIRDGRAVESGTLESLRHLRRSNVHATITGSPETLKGMSGVTDLTIDAGQVTFGLDHEHLRTVMPHLSTLGLQDMVVTPPSLEEIFLRHYGDGPGNPETDR